MDKLPLLMTASVSTRGMKGACFSDAEREKMYVEALRFYLETLPPDQPIVFAENSGWNLAEFARKISMLCGNVEFISVDPSLSDQTRGKGYNEVLLINQAVEKSTAIREAGAFLKVTGRYPIYNLSRYLKGALEFFNEGGRYYGDMKDHKIFDFLFPNDTDRWNGHAAETAIFASTVEFYLEKLASSFRDCNDYTNNWVEVVWYRLLAPYRKAHDSKVRLRYLVEPQFGGVQGSIGATIFHTKNNEGLRVKIGRCVGNFIRVFLPWLWL